MPSIIWGREESSEADNIQPRKLVVGVMVNNIVQLQTSNIKYLINYNLEANRQQRFSVENLE